MDSIRNLTPEIQKRISKCGLHDTLAESNIKKNKAKIHQMTTKTSQNKKT